VRVGFEKKKFSTRMTSATSEEKRIVQSAGFIFDAKNNSWYTQNPRIAVRVKKFFDESAKREINRIFIAKKLYTGPLLHPPHLKIKPWQVEPIRFALNQNRSYLAMAPGTGKTICAAVIRNTLSPAYKAFYICPPFLIGQVTEELKKWATSTSSAFIFPDSKIERDIVTSTIKKIILTNREFGFKNILFVDEAHRYKNHSANRSKALFKKIIPLFERVVFLSGTPNPNGRPIELYTILSNCAPETIGFMNRFDYGKRYCAAYHTNYGWDFSGASNLEELRQKILGTFMIKVSKKAIGLPPVLEQAVFIEGNLPTKMVELERSLLKKYSPKDLLKASIGEEHIASYRRELGMLKVKGIVKYVSGLLDDPDEKILLFAHHKEVIATLKDALCRFNPLQIVGGTDTSLRHKIVKTFREDKKQRLMILQIQAGGIGFNITEASRVIFAEFSWVPGDNQQAIDRVHRIGKDGSVCADYLVYKDSLDSKILEANLSKLKNINSM